MDKHKLILPISILLGCIIIGGFYYVSQVKKQKSGKQIKIETGEQTKKLCELPPFWSEVQGIYKLCNLTQIEQATDFSDTYSPGGANGSFDYCNTLVWRKYTTDAGTLYTYEKIRYQHFPNSEVGEYRAPEILYNEMTNNRPCTASTTINEFDNDNDISADAFPSRNNTLQNYKPKYWVSFFNRHYDLFHWVKI